MQTCGVRRRGKLLRAHTKRTNDFWIMCSMVVWSNSLTCWVNLCITPLYLGRNLATERERAVPLLPAAHVQTSSYNISNSSN